MVGVGSERREGGEGERKRQTQCEEQEWREGVRESMNGLQKEIRGKKEGEFHLDVWEERMSTGERSRGRMEG